MTELLHECYALEKIHGTSAHIKSSFGELTLFGGCVPLSQFRACFSEEVLEQIRIDSTEHEVEVDDGSGNITKKTKPAREFIIYGEAYGGKVQKMKSTYGDLIRFVAFDVVFDGMWLDVGKAHNFCFKRGIDFVDYKRIPCTLEAINAERDRESVQAIKNGCGHGKKREGIVIRPINEFLTSPNLESRLIYKHKCDEFSERSTPSDKLVSAEKLQLITEAGAIADEWVTDMRLAHVLDKMEGEHGFNRIPEVIKRMIEDVEREAEGEIVTSKEARKAVGDRAVKLYKGWLTKV
jgi:hypothetical protein